MRATPRQSNEDVRNRRWIVGQAGTDGIQLHPAAHVEAKAVEAMKARAQPSERAQGFATGPDFVQQAVVVVGKIDHGCDSRRISWGQDDPFYNRVGGEAWSSPELASVNHILEHRFPFKARAFKDTSAKSEV